MLRRRGERSRRARSRPDSKRQEADGGVRAHCDNVSRTLPDPLECEIGYLNLQHLITITSNAFVMHFVVGVIGISSTLVLHKRKTDETLASISNQKQAHLQSAARRSWGWNVTTHEATIPEFTSVIDELSIIQGSGNHVAHLDIQFDKIDASGRQTYRSNSYAKSLARVPCPKPVTYRVVPPRDIMEQRGGRL